MSGIVPETTLQDSVHMKPLSNKLAPVPRADNSIRQVASSAGWSLAGLLPYVGPAVSLLGIGAQMYTNRKNREMQEQINEQNRRLVKEQNAYNSPVAQMARYKAAGINPLAAMDNITSGNQAQAAEMIAPQYESPDFGQVGDAVANSLDYRLQESLNKSTISLRATQEALNVARTGTERQQYEVTAALFGMNAEKLAREVQLLGGNINLAYARVEESVAHANNLDTVSGYYRQATDNLLKEYGLYDTRLELLKAQVASEMAKSGLFAQQIRLTAAEAGISEQQLAMQTAYAAYYCNSGLELDKIRDAYNTMSTVDQAQLNKNAALYASIESKYYEEMAAAKSAGLYWSKEKTRAEAGWNYDYWQNNVWQSSVSTVTGGFRDIGIGIGGLAGGASSFNALMSMNAPRPRIGF